MQARYPRPFDLYVFWKNDGSAFSYGGRLSDRAADIEALARSADSAGDLADRIQETGVNTLPPPEWLCR